MKPSRLLLPLAGTFAALTLAACGSSSGSTPVSAPPPTSTPTSAAASASASPSVSPSPPASASAAAPVSGQPSSSASSGATALTVDEHANGSTVHLAVGGSLLLVLHSTLWQSAGNSAPGLLEQVGRPLFASPGGCRPGQGCGTVTTRYLARQAGTVTLTDHRDSCGEARRCKPGEGDYRLTVVVSARG